MMGTSQGKSRNVREIDESAEKKLSTHLYLLPRIGLTF